MPEDEASSYSVSMVGTRQAEQAALVALLQVRPEGLRWPEIAAEVLEAGSALDVWHRLVPAMLIGLPGQPDALESADQEISRWALQGCPLVAGRDYDPYACPWTGGTCPP
jgi:hypothetical protein